MKAITFTPGAARQWLGLSADTRKRIDAKKRKGDIKSARGKPVLE